MAKFLVTLLAVFALPCGQALAQSGSHSGQQKQTQQQTAPATATDPQGPGGPTQHPNPEIVPPSGPQEGISSEAEQPRPRQRVAPVPPQEPAAATPSDQQLQQNIEKALNNEPNLTKARVQVQVAGGTITLEGTVPSGKERQTAARIAKSFAGDRKVEDKINVVGEKQQ